VSRRIVYWASVLFALVGTPVSVASLLPQGAPSLFPADPAAAHPLTIELHLPLKQLKKLGPTLDGAFPARLAMADGTDLPLDISPRGKSRRKTCSHPPLRLNFKKKATTGTLFEGQNKLKLVTHCSRKLSRGGYLAAEMLAYRLFNLLSEVSFRVRAVEVTYVDSDDLSRQTWPAFLIEHKRQLAARVGGELLDTEAVELAQLNASYAAMVSIFSYMIGNIDFSLRRGPANECCHNAVPIALTDTFSVPYDFDASMLVGAPYTAASSGSGKPRRVYRGYCAHNAQLLSAVDDVLAQQDAVLKMTREFSDLPGLKHARAERLLLKFFAVLSSEKAVRRKLVNNCR